MEEQLPPQDALDTRQPDQPQRGSITPLDSLSGPGHPIMLADPTEAALASTPEPNSSSPADDDGPGGNEPYKGMLWIKDKFEEYRVQTDERMGMLRMELDRRGATIEMLNGELTLAREKIAHLSTKLEKNMSLLMNIHKELDKTLVTDQPAAAAPDHSIPAIPDQPSVIAAGTPPTTPETAHGGSGDQAGNV